MNVASRNLNDASQDTEGNAATVFIRYEDPDTGVVHEVNQDFHVGDFTNRFEETSPRFQLTAVVAEYAEILRESFWAKEGTLEAVLHRANEVLEMLPRDSDVSQFVELVARAEQINKGNSVN